MFSRTLIAFALGALLGSPLVALAEGAWKRVPVPLEWRSVGLRGGQTVLEAPLMAGATLRRDDGPARYGMVISAHGYKCQASIDRDEPSVTLLMLSDTPDGKSPLGMYMAKRTLDGTITAGAAIPTAPGAPVPNDGKDM